MEVTVERGLRAACSRELELREYSLKRRIHTMAARTCINEPSAHEYWILFPTLYAHENWMEGVVRY